MEMFPQSYLRFSWNIIAWIWKCTIRCFQKECVSDTSNTADIPSLKFAKQLSLTSEYKNFAMHVKRMTLHFSDGKQTKEGPFSSVSSVTQSCPTLCDPMNRSTPGPLSITNSQSSLRLTFIESVRPSSHLILCHPLLLLPSIPPSIRVFSVSQLFPWGSQSTGVSALASFLPKKSQSWSPSEWTGWISLQSKGLLKTINTSASGMLFSVLLTFVIIYLER